MLASLWLSALMVPAPSWGLTMGACTHLMQARRAGKNKRTAQPSMAEAIKHHAERQAAQTDRMELLRQQRDAQHDYQRRLQAWETECSRVRSTAAAADRDAVLKHTSIAMEKSNGDMQHYRSWMEELTRTWEQHKPQLDLPPKPEPLPQLPQRLGPNSSQRDQLGREEAPAEEDSDNDSQGVNVKKKVAILPSKPVSVSVGIVLLPLAPIVAAVSIQQGPADWLVVAQAQAQAQALRAKFNAVVETFSGGSKAPDDHPNDDNPEDTPGGHMEEGEMDEQRPRYTGMDEDYILELEAQQLQIQAENEALRQALSTITSQVKSRPPPPRRVDPAGRAGAPASGQPGAGAAGPDRGAPTGPSPLSLPFPLSLGSRSIPGPDKWTDACSNTHRRALAFCDDLERHCERYRLDVASTLPAFLTGAARNTWYPSIKESFAALYADVPDWPYLRAAFCEYTGDDLRDDCNVARTKLLDGAIKMSAGMLLGQYITEFRNNLLFAGNDSMCQPLLAMVFTRGLSSALQPAVLKDLAAFKNPTLSQAMEAAKQAQRNVVMLSTTTPSKGAGTSGVHAVQASSALGREAHPGRRGNKPPDSGGAGKRPRHDKLWSKKPLLPGQYCFKCNHPGHLTNHPCPFRHFTAAEARRRSGYPHPPEGAKKPGQAKSKPPSESGASESDQEPEPQPPAKAAKPRNQGMRRGHQDRGRIQANRMVSTPLSAKTAAKWLKEGGTGVVALVSYENLQDPPGVPPEQAAQLKSLLMEFSDVFEPITGLPPARDSTPFLVNYGQSPITPVLHKLPRPCLSPSAESFAKKWEHEVKHAQECMRVAQDRQQRYANKRRRDVTFSVGDSVLLSTKNLRNAPGRARKFLPRYVGPFKVTGKLGEAAYRLELPPTMSRLHPVFHVSLLKKYTGSQGFHPPPVMEWLEDAPHYEVHSLLSHRQVRFKKRMEYLVKWTGYDDTYNTWEPEAMLAGAPQILS
ncbi:hypothetical protein QJQ45_027430, partial [Haematococcus lacustris]